MINPNDPDGIIYEKTRDQRHCKSEWSTCDIMMEADFFDIDFADCLDRYQPEDEYDDAYPHSEPYAYVTPATYYYARQGGSTW